jgi:hypothetical protein
MNTKRMALGFKKNDFAKKLVGIVEIVTGDKKAKLTLVEDGKKFANGTDTITVDLASLPKRPVIKPGEKTPRQYRVRMNPDGDGVEAITPVRGYFKARLVDLGKRENKDADPAPYEKVWNEGKDNENRHMEFFAVYEIVEGAYRGVQLPAYQIHYKFEESPDEEGFTRFTGDPNNPKATRLHQLVEWGEYHGSIWSEPIRWPDDGNILPELLERVLDADTVVNLVMDKGYIQSIQPSEDDDEDFEAVVVEDEESAAVDEMLDGDDEVEEVEVKPAKKAEGKVKAATGKAKREVRKHVEASDDL